MKKAQSRRQELLNFVETGRLSQAVAAHLSAEAVCLLVDITIRYCEPRPPRSARAKLERK